VKETIDFYMGSSFNHRGASFAFLATQDEPVITDIGRKPTSDLLRCSNILGCHGNAFSKAAESRYPSGMDA
jgi:hypothetical protein